MSEKKIKWGFIGCGEVTKYKSGPAFQKVEGSEVIAVMSRDGAKAKAYAKERGTTLCATTVPTPPAPIIRTLPISFNNKLRVTNYKLSFFFIGEQI